MVLLVSGEITISFYNLSVFTRKGSERNWGMSTFRTSWLILKMKYLVMVNRRLKFISCIHISFVVKIAMWILAEYEGSIYIREMAEVNIEIVRSSEICTLGSELGSFWRVWLVWKELGNLREYDLQTVTFRSINIWINLCLEPNV